MFSDVQDAPATVTMVEPLYVLTGPEFDPWSYYGIGSTTRVDGYGRRWVLDELDLEAVAQDLEQARLEQSGGGNSVEAVEATDTGALHGIAFNEDVGATYEVELTGWDVHVCNDQNAWWDHNGNGPMVQADPMDALTPKRSIVWILVPGAVDCTGTVVAGDDPGEMAILTAAHCVTDSEGTPLEPNLITVCSLENLDENTVNEGTEEESEARCFGIDGVMPDDEWMLNGDDPYYVATDVALLFIGDDEEIGGITPMSLNVGYGFLQVWVNFGDGTFGTAVWEEDLPVFWPYAVAVEPLTGKVAVTSESGLVVFGLSLSSEPVLNYRFEIEGVRMTGEVAWTDANGDDAPDLLVDRVPGTDPLFALTLFTADGDDLEPVWSVPVPLDLERPPCHVGPRDNAVAVGDFDLDGDEDFVYARHPFSTMFYLNDGTGQYTPDLELVNRSGPLSVADRDGDGDLDIALMGCEGDVEVFDNQAIPPLAADARR